MLIPDFGSGTWFFTHPGSRGQPQKGTGFPHQSHDYLVPYRTTDTYFKWISKALPLYFNLFKLTQPLTVPRVQLLYTVKEKERKPYPLPYGLRNPYRNRCKSESCQDYARKPQRNCAFMNSVSVKHSVKNHMAHGGGGGTIKRVFSSWCHPALPTSPFHWVAWSIFFPIQFSEQDCPA
jgi:hypothetical protein